MRNGINFVKIAEEMVAILAGLYQIIIDINDHLCDNFHMKAKLRRALWDFFKG